MLHGDFKLGLVFECGDRQWLCTDIGTRVIVAVLLVPGRDPRWLNGPPYAVAERVFDENDLSGCHLEEKANADN